MIGEKKRTYGGISLCPPENRGVRHIRMIQHAPFCRNGVVVIFGHVQICVPAAMINGISTGTPGIQTLIHYAIRRCFCHHPHCHPHTGLHRSAPTADHGPGVFNIRFSAVSGRRQDMCFFEPDFSHNGSILQRLKPAPVCYPPEWVGRPIICHRLPHFLRMARHQQRAAGNKQERDFIHATHHTIPCPQVKILRRQSKTPHRACLHPSFLFSRH